MTPRERFLAPASYVFLCFAWGSTYIGISVVVKSMAPFWFAGMRFLLSGLLLLVFCFAVRAPMPKRGEWGPLVVMALLYMVISNGLLCWGEKYVKGGIASNLAGLTPLMVALIMAMLPRGERLRPTGWLGLLIGAAGVVVLVWDKILGSTIGDSTGEIALLGACLAWASGTVYSRYKAPGYNPLTLVTMQMLLGGAGLIAVSRLTEEPFLEPPTPGTWLAFAYMVLIGGILGFLAFTYLIQKMPATKASTFGYVNPAVGLALGAIVQGDTYATHQLVGSAIILVAVLLVHLSKG